jgi:nmrA family protein
MADIVKILSDKTGRKFNYVEENIEEAYESRKKWPAEAWQYDAWVSTYTAVAAGEQAGISNDIERVLGRKPISLKDNI